MVNRKRNKYKFVLPKRKLIYCVFILALTQEDYIISKAASAGAYASNTDIIKLNSVDYAIYDVKTAIYGKSAAAGLVLSDLYQVSDIADNQWPMYRPTYLAFSANSKGVSGIMATGSGAFQL